MSIKLLIVLALLAIVGSLASALFFMMKDKGDSDRSVKALTWRIGLSVTLFLLILVGFATGVIKPHGIMPRGTDTPPATQAPADGQQGGRQRIVPQ